ncbi:cyclic AMP-dependent transcription factor ATF-2-like isoform X2 [Physella acuta]|uniref:cyclic AMP-dependent transcription factor ATF-2-like isoform X2 n=1 Tax=Physella acuta TaxID=109671 RepID=UPI0027DB03A6|nr:cyclic AMP-dependent transcription factor ATF-2-like isoform X2 [Physella acuta]
MNDDKPFVCSVSDCGMRFTNEDHLNVHSKKHEMSLALNSGGQSSNSPAHHFLDQTPTPTKFLKTCEEIGLFQELSSNPFDHAYKKALDSDPPLPGPPTGELNTPTLILTDTPKHLAGATAHLGQVKANEPPKPSPLAKTSASKIVLDLSGKSVMTAQPAANKMAAKRNLTAQDADSTSDVSPVHEQVMALETSPQIAHSVSHNPVTSSSLTAFQQEVKKEMDEGDINLTDNQQCTMQVLLQLPTGETVPISIPATINKLPYFNSQQVQLSQALPQQIQPAPAKSTAPMLASSQTTTMALKQRLKAQLQSQLSPTAKSSEVSLPTSNSTAYISNAATSISGQAMVGDTSPIMMVDSPGSEMNFSDSSDYSIDSKRQKMSPESGDPEERRRKFLERNRAAAARCRQKRKHWISNLEKKADELQNTNFRLQTEVKLLRGEVAQLKTLLLAHKDCPVTQQQRSQGQLQHIVLTEAVSQDLAQVVPTSDRTSQPLQTIVKYLQEAALTQEHQVHE